MKIEDDLSAPSVKLRAEIKRLRSLVPQERQEWRSVEEHEREEILCAMSRFLCGIKNSGAGCACPGTCMVLAEYALKGLIAGGYHVHYDET